MRSSDVGGAIRWPLVLGCAELLVVVAALAVLGRGGLVRPGFLVWSLALWSAVLVFEAPSGSRARLLAALAVLMQTLSGQLQQPILELVALIPGLAAVAWLPRDRRGPTGAAERGGATKE